MQNIRYCKLFNKKYTRCFSSKLPSSNVIRKEFIEFFEKNDHKFIRSSPVVPYCDPTVAFVNAGMNQFKNIFLGNLSAPCKRAVNSQKCVRVGGKHNDLSIVGSDSYHHTFFEMLGNWSFADYFKEDACKFAWTLLKDIYKINTDRLYVTYFGGDETLNLKPDLECRNIWLEIGVKEERILPFGIKENFWEMGTTGPCGPCTEIHIDHINSNKTNERAKYVNTGRSDLTELWNLVFIQYNRNEDGSISSLPNFHVDTGMGLERLVAILQNKNSNYDTDLFMPIIDTIHKISKAPAYNYSFDKNSTSYMIDSSYRILSDHSRMVTACLADGMFPDQNHKLRKIIRKSILLSERTFKNKKLFYELIPKVIEILGDTYPEMEKNYKQIIQLISHEDEIFTALRKNTKSDMNLILENHPTLDEFDIIETPGFILGFKELEKICKINNQSDIPIGEISFKLYDTYGIHLDTIPKLLSLFNLKYDQNEFEKFMTVTKKRTLNTFSKFTTTNDVLDKSKLLNQLKIRNLLPTDNTYKYNYEFNDNDTQYYVNPITSKVIAIFNDQNELIDEIKRDGTYGLITDKSNFHHESGGQESDSGCIFIKNYNNRIEVQSIQNIDGYLIHTIQANSDIKLSINDQVEMIINNHYRNSNILNHTATHLLNAAVRYVANCAVCQKSSSVTKNGLKLELGVFGTKLEKPHFEKIENIIRDIINRAVDIKKYEINVSELLRRDDITLVPGEVYPEKNINVLEINENNLNFKSKELCCGTHALNTKHLIDFCITNVKLGARGSYIITAVAGDSAKNAHTFGQQLWNEILAVKNNLKSKTENIEDLEYKIHRIKNSLTNDQDNNLIPYNIKIKSNDVLNLINRQLKDITKTNLKEFINIEMKNVMEQHSDEKFIVHFLISSSLLENVKLSKATYLCNDRPIMVISLSRGLVKALCCVPPNYINSNFNAELWMQDIAKIFETDVAQSSKDKDIKEACKLKSKKIKQNTFDELLEGAMQKAKDFAKKNM